MKRSSISKPYLGFTILILFAAYFNWQLQPTRSVQAQGRTNLVLAFYYAWYNPGSFGPGKTPFQPPEPYSSSDHATIQRHVSQAQSTGLDGFVQSWYGPNEPITNGNFQALLDIAAASGFKAAIDFEPATFLKSNDERANALKSLLQTHANHPAYLRMDGKPVIFFWANWAYSVEDWAYIRSIADPNHNSIWIAEGANTEYLAVFDGLHLYNTAWASNPAGIASTWGANTRAAAETYGAFKYWVATAMPGFDDRHLGRGEASVYRDRAGGAYYQNSFAAAAESNPDLLIVTSFNEWAEGSNIEPSVEFGNQYLDLTAQLVSAYKSGGVAPPPPLPQPTSEPASEEASGGEGASGNASSNNAPNDDVQQEANQNISPMPTPTAQPDGSIIYEVQQGDTLSAIAFRFQVPLEDLYRYNDLTSDSLINVGQPIVIGMVGDTTPVPTIAALPEGVEAREDGLLIYKVEANDTLLAIAVRYDLTLEELLAMNKGLTKDSVLQIGQDIIVGERRQPASVGGSTDFPAGTPTVTAMPSPSPTATEHATETPTAAQTVAISSTVSGVPTTVATNTSTPSQNTTPTEDNGLINYLPVAGGILTVVGLTSGLFLYLGRRRI